ncbi:hypothetical protein UK23_33235 [Lentzea aerocolonigenes]|uniref:PE domain-containing protein n=1 Tax=Lentzea aerocolonigenes TaxID=68170 RepID=A0A0F0GJC7_LENAE|nr:hypothetical protein [Lentzea aerocolonigenes]KJK43435.1 hypothetical protein UK23_33235 [Lentzea aerocolonigenes]
MAEVNLDGGAVDMYTDQLETAVASLSTAGTAAQQKWEASRTKIFDLEKRLGKGEMGASFIAKYNDNANALVASLDGLGVNVEQFVTAGRDSIGIYLEADRKAKAGMPKA